VSSPDLDWLSRTIIDKSPIAVLFADCQGIIRLWNAGAEQIFGYTAAEMIGHTMDPIIPEKHRPRHREGYTKVMQTGITKYGRDKLAVPALRKDGSRISVEFNVVLVRGVSGEVLGVAALMQDVTARWESEKLTKRRIADLEARLNRYEQTVSQSPGD
jgi:PAS domain S-box-containing protein